jgi:hypothetical protein
MYGSDIAVNMSITTSKHDYKVMTVVGPRKPGMQIFINSLERGLASTSHFWVSRLSDTVHRDFRFIQRGSSSPITSSISESSNQLYKTDEAAYYYFYKILTNSQYSIGADLAEFMTSQSASPRSPPREQMLEIISKISSISTQLDSNFLTLRNPSSTLVDDLLPRVRPAVERYMFEALGSVVYMQYKSWFAEEDAKFSKIAKSLREGEKDKLFEFCGIKSQHRLPFSKSINLLDQFALFFESTLPNSSIQKILSLLISVKTEILVGSSTELESMDEIAPIFLYLVVASEGLRTPTAIFHFLLDYMPIEERLESEGKTVGLLEGAVRIVIDQG